MTPSFKKYRNAFLLTLMVLRLSFQCQSLVISAPRIAIPSDAAIVPNDRRATSNSVTLRIRSTKLRDIDQISGLLAAALVNSDNTAEQNPEKRWKNWKVSMEILRLKAALEKLLVPRVHAIAEGEKVRNKLSAFDLLEVSEFDMLRFVWSNDHLRQSIERAAKASPEPHAWRGHNFETAPLESCWLQHKMFTAEDAETGKIIGYCEVAMLSSPKVSVGGYNDGEEAANAPTILNLVTSPKYRRRGVASKLLKTATRYVSQSWPNEDRLSLYVDMENASAITMYTRLGFEKTATIERGSRIQWYMSRQLDSTDRAGLSGSFRKLSLAMS